MPPLREVVWRRPAKPPRHQHQNNFVFADNNKRIGFKLNKAWNCYYELRDFYAAQLYRQRDFLEEATKGLDRSTLPEFVQIAIRENEENRACAVCLKELFPAAAAEKEPKTPAAFIDASPSSTKSSGVFQPHCCHFIHWTCKSKLADKCCPTCQQPFGGQQKSANNS
jgi:hypothetical protein